MFTTNLQTHIVTCTSPSRMGKLMVRIRVSACFLLKKDDRAFYYHNLLTELTGHMLIIKTDAYATIALFQV